MNQKVADNIETVIFDLGGVLFDIDYSLTQKAFIDLGATDFHAQYSQQAQKGVFDDFEKGHISPDAFRQTMLGLLPKGISTEQVDKAWNALLLSFPATKVELLKRLRKRYRIFLLSNTNNIHLPAVLTMMDEWHGKGVMDTLFEKQYYSCRMGMRKPDAEIYRFVTDENKLDVSTTLFIDDIEKNLHGASSIGLQTLHCTPSVSLFEYFAT